MAGMFGFTDLIRFGTLPESWFPSIATDDQAYNFNHKRYQFYQALMNALKNGQTNILETLFSTINLTDSKRTAITKNANKLVNSLRYLINRIPYEERPAALDEITTAIQKNPLLHNVLVVTDQERTPVTDSKDKDPFSLEKATAFKDVQNLERKKALLVDSVKAHLLQIITLMKEAKTDAYIKEAHGLKLQEELNELQELQKHKIDPPTTGADVIVGGGLDDDIKSLSDILTALLKKGAVLKTVISDNSKQIEAFGIAIPKDSQPEGVEDSVDEDHKQSESIDVGVSDPDDNGSIQVKAAATASGGGSFYEDLLTRAELLKNTDPDKSKGLTSTSIKKGREEIDFELQNNSLYSPKNAEITVTDRIIFIAVCYILRAISLYLVEWGISTQLVTSFQSAFTFYFGIYITLFLMIVILVNSSDQLFFRLMFYYMSFDNGFMRVSLHIIIQMLLIPIPFLVNDTNIQGLNLGSGISTFQQRRSLMHSIENFSLLVWIFVSFIACTY